MRVSIKTLGCKVNQAESDLLIAAFERAGLTVVDFDEVADCYIVNSCAVTEEAERKTRQYVRRAARRNPKASVILIGCCAKLWNHRNGNPLGEKVVILPAREKEKEVCRFLEERFGIPLELPPFPHPPRARAWVKVEEGCDHFCSFCLVPYLREGVKSRKFEEILSEIHHLVQKGIREIVLCGTNLGYFGRDTKEGTLIDLIEFLVARTENVRFRLSSLEPYLLSEDFITRYFALGTRVCPHLHLPLQSGSDRVLARMRREYTTRAYADLVATIRSLCPQVAITTDIIMGFPGETEEDFEETVRFCREVGFARMHVFAFSARPGTVAFEWEKTSGVPKSEKQRRVQRLLEIGRKLSEEYHRHFLGKELHVLIESVEENTGLGHSENYIPVRVQGISSNEIREIVSVLVEEARDTYVRGRLIKR
ncbi:MAG: tRNA (N(6)-L-threonylcarbamoyladenosine(37)-C(2))-methylthiotransferase MtaB [Candidatus Caldatribacterium sp.]|nr:tRNA (N(6)-L-threonylcarbamoyladenosine(37)-C(2))-methylthiotransferase MtaB [Candidatus Caldatribacterium sp.]